MTYLILKETNTRTNIGTSSPVAYKLADDKLIYDPEIIGEYVKLEDGTFVHISRCIKQEEPSDDASIPNLFTSGPSELPIMEEPAESDTFADIIKNTEYDDLDEKNHSGLLEE